MESQVEIILIKTTSDKSGAIMKELLFKSSELGINIRFTPISEERYTAWVGMQGKNRYIITLLGRQLTARHIADVAGVISRQGLNIDAIKRMTGRVPLHEDERAPKSCIEFSVRGSLTEEATTAIQEQFMSFSNNGVDISFQRDDIFRRSRRLICFDMDSTLIETEVIDELAERAGVGAQVRAITERAMRGEIDFRESFTERVALLKGLDVSVMEEIAQQLPITEGLERMMTILKRVGYKTAILSGGFTYFGNYLRQRFGFDYVYANELEIVDGRLTGRYAGEIVDGRRKDSDGCTCAELADFMAKQGCTMAYNLDGGNSALMWFGGENYSEKTVKAERSVSDIIYFATAIDAANTEE